MKIIKATLIALGIISLISCKSTKNDYPPAPIMDQPVVISSK